ncbi:MAG: hypothetical protein KVP17_005027 [Porospora cf. gigantea B]|uniref:uncharacterized protein n=1 Tax=Porospora cf. gigantea B TaxID=2853592 RepID=UPI0035719E77|nr:MAG: hypothetical protein KVP17_005027 [Porospora cf. gigantea B]
MSLQKLQTSALEAAASLANPSFRQYFQRRTQEEFDRFAVKHDQLPSVERDSHQLEFQKKMEDHVAFLRRQSQVQRMYDIPFLISEKARAGQER